MSRTIKRVLLQLWHNGIQKVDPAVLVDDALAENPYLPQSLHVISLGKSAIPMAWGAQRALGSRIHRGLILVPRNYKGAVPKGFRKIVGDHPIPTLASLRAGKALFSFVHADPEASILFLISGGASACVVLPKKGISFPEYVRQISAAINSGKGIHQLNQIRTRLSQIKGGKLIARHRGRIFSYLISDVFNDDISAIASGLTNSSKKLVRNRVLFPCKGLALAIATSAKDLGYRVRLANRPVFGNSFSEGRRWGLRVRRLSNVDLYVSHGETNVTVKGSGRGSRNLEFAIGVASAWQRSRRHFGLSIASDGKDGNSKFVGGYVDGETMRRAEHAKLHVDSILANNCSDLFFEKLGDGIRSKPTGVNMADIQLAYIRPALF